MAELEEIKKKSPLAIQLATSAWTKEKTSHIEMDTRLCEEFAKILYEEIKKPNLGNANTKELLQELESRLESKIYSDIVTKKVTINLDKVDLNYKTTDY